MIKAFSLITMFILSFKSHAEVPFWDIKGMHEMVKNPAFSPVEGFLALKTGTLERIRFYGPYVLGSENTHHPQWLHPAFLIKEQDDPYAFSKRFEYPLDPIAALIQWLFPSVDGVFFVANDRDKDVVGSMGRNLKAVSRLPTIRTELKTLQNRLRQIPNQAQLIADLDSKMDGLRKRLEEFKGVITQDQIAEKKGINQNLKDLAQEKDKVKTEKISIIAQELETQIQEKTKFIQKLEFMPKILKCIYEGMLDSLNNRFQECLEADSHQTSSSSFPSQSQDQRTTFIQILDQALKMDGTFTQNHGPLYPKHIALHALLGYIWSICDNKAQVIAVIREAGLLKAKRVHQHRLTSEILENDKYTKSDYDAIKKSPNPTFEQLAYAGYGYEVYENPNTEMVIYSSADINPSEKDFEKYPYLSTHRPYPDCGETALRNFFNLVVLKAGGEFDAGILPQFQTSHMGKIRQFYENFSNISSQKTSLANTAWSTIVSNLNGTANSLHSLNPMDVRYNGYTNIKASLGMKNILNVMAKLTGDSVLNQEWRTGKEEERHIAQKLTQLCQIFSRGETFNITWEINDQSNTAPVHGDFKFIITRHGISSDFVFSITNIHFALKPPVFRGNDWRKTKGRTIDIRTDALKPFYSTINFDQMSPFLDPSIRDKDVESLWKHERFPIIPLTLRFLYKNFASVIDDRQAQLAIARGLTYIDKKLPEVQKWVKTLWVDKPHEIPNYTPLLIQKNLSISVFKLLVEIGLDKEVRYGGKTPLIHAISNYCNAMAAIYHSSQIPSYLEKITFLLDSGADIEGKDNDGNTPLLIASMENCTQAIEILLNKGANIEAKNRNGDTPLSMASSRHNNIKAAAMLLSKGANIEARNENGNTPLSMASLGNRIEAAAMLLSKGANIEARNRHGSTPLLIASNWSTKIAEMIQQEQKKRAASKIQTMVRKRQASKHNETKPE